MTMMQARSRQPAAFWTACIMVLLFVALQAATLGYGTRINDLAHIRDYRVGSDVVSGSGLTRDRVIGSTADRAESLDLWMVRFKLYSVEADEVDAIMALARIQPRQLQFDPKFYQYGGAFLYPLGGWYLALSKLGLIHVAPLDQLLAQPEQMDRIWIAGRAFVLAAFAASALLLFLTLIEIAPAGVALAGLAIYLFCPASIMYSQIIKPHWYALLWVNAALLIVVRAFVRNRLTLGSELLLAAAIGLTVGSVVTFSTLAVLLWCALAVLAASGALSVIALVRIPLVAIVVFLLSNPYYVLNWPTVLAERASTAGWFEPSLSPSSLLLFVQNSLFTGFGVVTTLLIFAVVAWTLIRGPLRLRLLAIAIIGPIVSIAVMTANFVTWNSNFRFIPYVLPAALILVALPRWRHRTLILAFCALATVAQALPLKLAYFDENDDAHATRLLAAAWIDANIPTADAICLVTNGLAPFEVPPFRFDRYRLNSPDCRWLVRVERNPLSVTVGPGYEIAKRFTPRLSPQIFPLVWEHINPQITIYRKAS